MYLLPQGNNENNDDIYKYKQDIAPINVSKYENDHLYMHEWLEGKNG